MVTEHEPKIWDVARKLDEKINVRIVATEKLRKQLIKEAEEWMKVRPVSPSATYKATPPTYAKRNAAACLRAAALLAEISR